MFCAVRCRRRFWVAVKRPGERACYDARVCVFKRARAGRTTGTQAKERFLRPIERAEKNVGDRCGDGRQLVHL